MYEDSALNVTLMKAK